MVHIQPLIRFQLVVLAAVAGLSSADIQPLTDKSQVTPQLQYSSLAPQSTAVIYHAQTFDTAAPQQLPVAPHQLPAAPMAATGNYQI